MRIASLGNSTPIHAYTVSDNSTGATPRIIVKAGTHNGITPTINGIPLTNSTAPTLVLSNSDTLTYFQIDYNTSGSIVSVEIMSGSTLPTANIVQGTAGSDYKLLSNLAITFVSGKAIVNPFNDAVSGPQGYSQCNNSSNVWLV